MYSVTVNIAKSFRDASRVGHTVLIGESVFCFAGVSGNAVYVIASAPLELSQRMESSSAAFVGLFAD